MSANGGTLNTPGTAQTATLNSGKGYHVLHGIGSNHPWFENSYGTADSTWIQPLGCPALPNPCPVPGLGNTGRNQFRGPGYVENSVSLSKGFAFFHERSRLLLRIDAFQLTNSPQFANPNSGSISASNFGQITGTLGSGSGTVNGVGGGRALQASAKFTF